MYTASVVGKLLKKYEIKVNEARRADERYTYSFDAYAGSTGLHSILDYRDTEDEVPSTSMPE
jgi:hypothetical protein